VRVPSTRREAERAQGLGRQLADLQKKAALECTSLSSAHLHSRVLICCELSRAPKGAPFTPVISRDHDFTLFFCAMCILQGEKGITT
jgi:hypothetical protein